MQPPLGGNMHNIAIFHCKCMCLLLCRNFGVCSKVEILIRETLVPLQLELSYCVEK